MARNILVISSTETFIVRGLEMKLKGIGADTAYAPLSVEGIKKSCDQAEVIVLYLDDMVDKCAEALVYINDHCFEKDKQIFIIGSKLEYENATNYIREGCIYKFYERPLNMEHFLDDMEIYFAEASRLARRKSILIVDDDVSYMTMIMEWLKNDYRVSIVNSGVKAITWLATNKADLVLLDYEMPVTTGPQVLEMIKSEASTSNIPVIFLTGKNDKDSIVKVLSLKPAGYLLKTIQKDELLENIDKFFKSQII